MASYNFKELETVVAQWANSSGQGFTAQEVGDVIHGSVGYGSDPRPSNITCVVGTTEMLKVAEDGFYVRGVKVPVDDKEAETVYNAFKEFLVWSRLHRD